MKANKHAEYQNGGVLIYGRKNAVLSDTSILLRFF